MQLSDFFIGKPGPGSISEAMQQRLPVIVVRNAWTMPQERYNTEWVEETRRGAGARFLQGHSRRRAHADRPASLSIAPASPAFRIKAVFEIPEILEQYCVSAAARSDRRRSHPAFPVRRAPASDRGSIRAAAERSARAQPPTSAPGSATRRRARRHRRASAGPPACGRIAARPLPRHRSP